MLDYFKDGTGGKLRSSEVRVGHVKVTQEQVKEAHMGDSISLPQPLDHVVTKHDNGVGCDLNKEMLAHVKEAREMGERIDDPIALDARLGLEESHNLDPDFDLFLGDPLLIYEVGQKLGPSSSHVGPEERPNIGPSLEKVGPEMILGQQEEGL